MTNQATPAVFNFNSHEVRTVFKDSVVWFVASDVAKVLEYRNASDLTRVLDSDERDTHNMRTPSGDQDMLIINESGLYHALFKSRKKEAQLFRKWVTNEVLPAIRKTGSYTAENTKTSKSTADDRTPLRDAINLLVSKKHILYPEAYSYVHQRFNVKHIDELEPSEITTAVEYVHKLVLTGEVLDAPVKNGEQELMHTISLTDDELCNLAWLWKAAERMRSSIEEVEAPLRSLKSGYAASFYSMSMEYRRVINKAKVTLERETRDINPHPTWLSHSNWRYALESLRN
ncbi:BRO family protein [Thorsellia anophelis]|uniref:Prophage antirepressor n=1 Tax=Thorsellia anophelis DSM 18579 TaxID=1123402 RepID=A0A1I0D8L6_9GAMM|nr:BRO family protein [Thorsellia anophelis]SET27996.1 Prophage antirepressor [Thorsellia anophelis DSM 18579]